MSEPFTSNETANRLTALEAAMFLGGDESAVTSRFYAAELCMATVKFTPRGAGTLPPMFLGDVPFAIAKSLAMQMNAETLATDGGNWHYLVPGTADNYSVLRLPVRRSERPETPEGMPETFGSLPSFGRRHDAVTASVEANREILKVAFKPRIWFVPVRHLGDVEA